LRNAVADMDTGKFFCPGSTLRVSFDNHHPLAYGMPDQGLVLFWNSPVFDILATPFNDHYAAVAVYPESELLQSGWLIGEEMLRRKAALIEARLGDGKVVLVGFRAQHRAQTHGTYKILFNCLLG
jgi:hypothetical protein